MTTNNPLESYIVRFRCVLAGMTLAEQEDIVAEIRAHIDERVSVSGMSIEETLARLSGRSGAGIQPRRPGAPGRQRLLSVADSARRLCLGHDRHPRRRRLRDGPFRIRPGLRLHVVLPSEDGVPG